MGTQAVQMVDADGSGSIDFDEFVDLMDIYRKAVLKETRKKCGFDDDQLYELTEMFRKYDADYSDNLDSKELTLLLKDLNMAPRTDIERIQVLNQLEECREMAEEAAQFVEHCGYISAPTDGDILVATMPVREAKRRASAMCDCKGFCFEGSPTEDPVKIYFKNRWELHKTRRNSACGERREEWTSFEKVREGSTTFYVFLRLLRILEDDKDRTSLAVERKAAEKAKMSHDEVGEFRLIFDHWYNALKELGDGCGAAQNGKALTSEGIARILRSLGLRLPSLADYDHLAQLCKECDQDGNGNVDFPDFLVLWRRLLDINFRNLNDVIAKHHP